jgi:two-component system response regulator CpxR
VVDDDAKLCRLIRGYLEPLGYEVSIANDGMAGLELALKESFDAMILDVMMPKLNGFELLKRLRATSNLPVLMLTGLGDEADRISGLEIGADVAGDPARSSQPGRDRTVGSATRRSRRSIANRSCPPGASRLRRSQPRLIQPHSQRLAICR